MSGLTLRQFIDDEDEEHVDFWWTPAGQAVRWGIFGGIILLFILYMVIGYWHATRRLRKGLSPLAYHRWLLNRQQRAQFDPSYRNPSVEYNTYRQEQYGMQSFPPPVYDPNSLPPPTYQPPSGGTKVDPSQWTGQPINRPSAAGESAPEYAPLMGPPAATAPHANETGSSSTSNNPYRV